MLRDFEVINNTIVTPTVKTGPFSYSSDLTYFEVAYYVFYGFLNEVMNSTSTTNSTTCLGYIKSYYDLTADDLIP